MITAAVVLAAVLLVIAAHLWFSTQKLRSRWHDIHPRRRKV